MLVLTYHRLFHMQPQHTPTRQGFGDHRAQVCVFLGLMAG